MRRSSPTRARCSATCASSRSASTRDEEPRELLLDTERSALQALFDMIRRFKVGYEVELHKRTIECSLLSLIGPSADEVAARALSFTASAATRVLAGAHVVPLEREHGHLLATIAGTPVRLIRTDVGIDALLDSAALAAEREALEAAGAVPVSEAGAEIVRVEHGRPRYGVDIDDGTIPQEAGLNERAVSFTKGCYVGPGDGRAPPLQGQAQPPPARIAPVRAGADRGRPAPRRAPRGPTR